jgi:hypothetical protein
MSRLRVELMPRPGPTPPCPSDLILLPRGERVAVQVAEILSKRTLLRIRRSPWYNTGRPQALQYLSLVEHRARYATQVA